MHNITPNTAHAIINVRLAISAVDSKDTNGIADGINELLRESVSAGFLADYQFDNSDEPAMVESDDNPMEDELFDTLQIYMICVLDSDHNEEWVKVETVHPLDQFDEDQLKEAFEGAIVIGERDRIFVGNVNASQRVVI